MNAIVEKWKQPRANSFNFVYGPLVKLKEFNMRVHKEMEITLLMGCNGKIFVGNAVENFSDGDLFMFGPELPHNLEIDEKDKGERITIHFLLDAFGDRFFNLPETKKIAQLLEESRLGVSFNGTEAHKISSLMGRMRNLDSFDRMIAFFKLLQVMAESKEKRILSRPGFSHVYNYKDYVTVNRIHQYIMARFERETISLDKISSHVNMAPATFCRYFKKHYNKTLTEFLNEVRVGHSCKLLLETDKSIAEICFESGYNQLTHFNRQFKRIMGNSPKEYRKKLNRTSFLSRDVQQ